MTATKERMEEARRLMMSKEPDAYWFFFDYIDRYDTKSRKVPQQDTDYSGVFDTEETRNYEDRDEEYNEPWFDENDKKTLLEEARIANKLDILDVFQSQGFYLQVDDIKKLTMAPGKLGVYKLLMKPALEREINNVLFDVNSNKTVEEKIKLINKAFNDSSFSYNAARMAAIKPLIEHYSQIYQAAEEERNPSEPEKFLLSGEMLREYNQDMRKDIMEYIKGNMDGQTLHSKCEARATNLIPQIEPNADGWKILKNFLLLLTVIGPWIKHFATGDAWYDNTTTDKVKEMKNDLSEMRDKFNVASTDGIEFDENTSPTKK